MWALWWEGSDVIGADQSVGTWSPAVDWHEQSYFRGGLRKMGKKGKRFHWPRFWSKSINIVKCPQGQHSSFDISVVKAEISEWCQDVLSYLSHRTLSVWLDLCWAMPGAVNRQTQMHMFGEWGCPYISESSKDVKCHWDFQLGIRAFIRCGNT